MERLRIRKRRAGMLLTAFSLVFALDAVALPACDNSQRYPKSLAFDGVRPLVYPESAFAAGVEGNVVYQYTVNDRDELVPRCLVNGTGSDELDNAVLARYSHATAIWPKRSARSPATVYQESNVASLVREGELRDAIHETVDGVQAFRPEAARQVGEPVYSTEAIADNDEGDVSVIANFNDRGEAVSVWIRKSSGYAILDRATMVAMLETKLKLRSSYVKVQRTFSFRQTGKSACNVAASAVSSN